VKGTDQPGTLDAHDQGNMTDSESNNPDPEIPQAGLPDDEGEDIVSPVGGEGKKKKPRGGFSVYFQHLGVDEAYSW
jgi:hypothetical protein